MQMCHKSGCQAIGHDPERLMLRTPSLAPFTALALSLSSLSQPLASGEPGGVWTRM